MASLCETALTDLVGQAAGRSRTAEFSVLQLGCLTGIVINFHQEDISN